MKNKKSVRAILLSVVLAVSMAVPVFGSGSTETISNRSAFSAAANSKHASAQSGTRKSKKPGWKKIGTKYYYFQADGTLYKKKGWLTVGENKYFINSDGSQTVGKLQLKDRHYYFNQYGKLLRSKSAVKIGSRYYSITSKGVMTKISAAKAQCMQETKKFIRRHTSSGMSKNQKFRLCFNYLLGYMNYRPVPFNKKDFVGKDWPYKRALSVYQSGLTGNCYGFACCVAACARELGYEPSVIVTTGDHGFVVIDGRYYDNMNGGMFGVSGHTAYNTYCRVLF